jgi:replication initiation protein RepC
MTMESAREARGEGCAGGPTGFRRLTPSLLRADRTAEDFDGLPDDLTAPGQVLAAFKAAAPRLGLSPRLVHAVDWLFRFTQPQDWGRGGRPIVWPSASLQQEALGLSPTQVKAINRALIEAELITMKDSPNGKRYGVRDRAGRITEAYGFDLSPIAARYGEFACLAEEARAERAEMGRLRRRATIARKAIVQILETAGEYGPAGRGLGWPGPRDPRPGDGTEADRAARGDGPGGGEPGAAAAHGARAPGIAAVRGHGRVFRSSGFRPQGAGIPPHQDTYKASSNPKSDTVMADEGCSAPAGGRVSNQAPAEAPEDLAETKPTRPARIDGTVLRLSTDELVRLAPRLRSYLTTPTPAWPAIVDAADWLRGELGVSKSLWGEACLAMGREEAAIAVAIVSAKPAGHFRSSPGGYFHGMVAKAKAGELNLARTIWGLRERGRKAGEGRSPRRLN